MAALTGLLLIPGTVAAQRRDKAAAYDFLLFLQSAASRIQARQCGRAIPDFAGRFEAVYGKWETRYRDRIARGEAAFRLAMTTRDAPYADWAKLEAVEKAIDSLSRPPADTSPLPQTDEVTRHCNEVLAELEAQLKD